MRLAVASRGPTRAGAAMTQNRLPKPDARFTQLILDYFAPQHLIIAEGEGARNILQLLKAKLPVPGRKAIYYADTARHQSPGLAESLRALDVNSVEIFANRLELLRTLPAIFSQSAPPYRVYVAASVWFIQAAEAIALQCGVAKELIMIEHCDALSRKVCCAVCASHTFSSSDGVVSCCGCGTPIRLSGFYRQVDHAHLGVPLAWPAVQPQEDLEE